MNFDDNTLKKLIFRLLEALWHFLKEFGGKSALIIETRIKFFFFLLAHNV